MDPNIPITQTKILVPRRRSDLLTRQRLLDMLYDLLDDKMIIVAAPAGYGKTTLLIDFAHHTEWPFCWYSIDPLDQEPRRFLVHFIAAISVQFPGFGKRSMSVLQNMAQGDLNLDSMVSVMVNDAYENISEHFVIVLDDYHLVNENDPISYFIDRFIQDIDENCHLIISSRTLVSLPDLPLMVARSQVGGLSFEELAFLPSEIQNLLLQNYQWTIPDSTAKDLTRQVEGWITGLLLSTQSLTKGTGNQLKSIKALGVGLYDYLAQQVLDQQPVEIREFLLRSSIMDEFDANFCKEVIGKSLSIQADWESLIDYLVHNNLFVLPIGEDRIWLRYHLLFQEFLQTCLQRERPEEAIKIRTRLAEFYCQRQEWERAHEIYQRMGQMEPLINLIENAGIGMITSGRLNTLNAWLETLAPKYLQANPTLLSIQGSVCAMRGDLRHGLVLFNQAMEILKTNPNNYIMAQLRVRRSTVYRTMGDYNLALIDAEEALTLTEGKEGLKDIEAEAWRMKGMAYYYLGHIKEALGYLLRSLAGYQLLNEPEKAAVLQMEIGMVHIASGNYLAAEQSFLKSLEYWQGTNNSVWLANILNNLGDLQRLMRDFETAIATLEKAIQYARDSGYLRLEAYALASIGDLYNDLEAADQAQEAYNKARIISNRIQDQYLLVYIDLAEAVLANRRGNTFKALKLLENAKNLASISGSGYEQNLCRLESGRIKIINQDYNKAIPELQFAEEYFQQEGHKMLNLRAKLYLAIAGHEKQPAAPTKKELKEIIATIAAPEYLNSMLATIREVKPCLETLKSEKDITPLVNYIFQEIDRFDQSLSVLRRHFRHAVSVVPFAPPKMYIQALGKMQVRVNDHVVTNADWQTQTARDLFFFLLARRDGVTKETVGEVFWIESSPAELKMRFKNTIYRLRHAVGKEAIIFQDDIYQFNTSLDYEYDVESFYREIYHAEKAKDSHQRINAYQAAIKFFQGPYLPDGDDTWILIERQKIHNAYVNAVMQLTSLYLEDGEYQNALKCSQKILSDDPCLEDAHRLAMRAYAGMGNRGAVARQYEYCRQVLSEELDVKPSQQTQSLYEMLMR